MTNNKRFFLNRSLLFTGGVWDLEIEEKYRKMYNVYAKILFCYSNIYYLVTQFIIAKHTVTDPYLFYENLGMAFNVVFVTVKVLILRMNKSKIKCLLNVLESDEFSSQMLGDFDYESFLHRSFNYANLFAISYICLVFVNYFVAYSSSVVRLFGMKNEDFVQFGGNGTCFEILFFHSWFPFSTDSVLSCGIAIALQHIGQFTLVLQVLAVDLFIANIEDLLANRFQILTIAFSFLRPNCVKRFGIRNTKYSSNLENNPLLIKEMNRSMKICSQELQSLINSTLEVENLFTFLNLGAIINSLCTIGFTLYTLDVDALLKGNVVYALYCLCLIYQLALLTSFGNSIMVSSGEVPNAIYFSDWYSASNTYKRSMIINMMRLQKPLFLTIGKFSPLTLSTFIYIMRTAYSICTVLKSKT